MIQTLMRSLSEAHDRSSARVRFRFSFIFFCANFLLKYSSCLRFINPPYKHSAMWYLEFLGNSFRFPNYVLALAAHVPLILCRKFPLPPFRLSLQILQAVSTIGVLQARYM